MHMWMNLHGVACCMAVGLSYAMQCQLRDDLERPNVIRNVQLTTSALAVQGLRLPNHPRAALGWRFIQGLDLNAIVTSEMRVRETAMEERIMGVMKDRQHASLSLREKSAGFARIESLVWHGWRTCSLPVCRRSCLLGPGLLAFVAGHNSH
eukprot:3415471-Amphidinium_carterae.1